MINRFYKTTPVDFQFQETQLQPLMLGLEARQKRFDAASELADELKNKYVQALPQDQATANALSQQWQQKIDQAVEGAQGDYSAVYRNIKSLKRDVEKAFAPGGKAAAIQQNYKAYYDALEEERKRLAKGEIRADQLDWWRNYTLSDYQGVGELNPTTGTYKQLMPEMIQAYSDPAKIGIDLAKELDPQKISVEQDTISGQYILRDKTTKEILPANYINQVVTARVANDPAFMEYYSQLYRFQYGKNPSREDITNYVATTVAPPIAATFAKNNIETSNQIRANQVALANMAEAGRNARHGDIMGALNPKPEYDTRLAGYEDQNPMGAKMSVEKAFGSADAGYSVPTGVSGNTQQGKIYTVAKDRTIETLQKQINDGSWQRNGGNAALMQHLIDSRKGYSDTATELLDAYNAAIAQNRTKLNSEIYFRDPAEIKDITERMISYGDISGMEIKVMPKGNTSYKNTTYDDFSSKYRKQIYKDGDPGKGLNQGVGITSFNRTTGEYNLNLPNGDKVRIKENTGYTVGLENIQKLFNQISNPSKEESTAVKLPFKQIEPTPQGWQEANYSNSEIRSRRVFNNQTTNGKLQGVEADLIFEFKDPNTDTWKPLIKYDSTGRGSLITPNDLLQGYEQANLPSLFGRTTSNYKGQQKLDMFGRESLYNNNED